ncbi:hypothetical protein PpBr36_03904 [Pyricularia pennisetigena]|uniref:hypothetical protein n=1 Tax=Pyricularia pennisetigena TaxID=1578925 RepID=UPI001150D171|nr:hypothetical protein PpBr36_03904 [Pyricularia pennisetigena]TLS31582.1 hypothetical protein PpBr36_03904 [Pyricularia pennisetigena]
MDDGLISQIYQLMALLAIGAPVFAHEIKPDHPQLAQSPIVPPHSDVSGSSKGSDSAKARWSWLISGGLKKHPVNRAVGGGSEDKPSRVVARSDGGDAFKAPSSSSPLTETKPDHVKQRPVSEDTNHLAVHDDGVKDPYNPPRSPPPPRETKPKFWSEKPPGRKHPNRLAARNDDDPYNPPSSPSSPKESKPKHIKKRPGSKHPNRLAARNDGDETPL